jgi:two-component system sensor histidine kinase KdpD
MVLSRPRFSIPRPHRPSTAGLLVAGLGLALATPLAAIVHGQFGIQDASIVYLLPVVAVGMGYGSWLAVSTAVASFLLYDFFFVDPLYTFSVAAPDEWLDLLLFLVVAIAIGRLSALQLQRRREAELRSAEARAMFAMSRDIATAATALEAAPLLVGRLAREAEMERVWIGLGAAIADERVVADSVPGEARPPVPSRWLLHSHSADAQPSWSRVRELTISRSGDRALDRRAPRPAHVVDEPVSIFRVPVEAGGETIGSLWATRRQGDPFPGRSHTRLLAAAADQFGQSVVRDRLAAEATAAEVARQSDALKSALLDSVSHDLRTPLSAIRAAAGNLMDPDVEVTPQGARASAGSIDREAERLSRLVRNMLDLGRIEGGALRPSVELYDLADLVEPVIERMRPSLAPSDLEVAVAPNLPPVRVDAVLVDQILTNLLENAARYAAGRRIKVSARQARPARVDLAVEDGGPGVPAAALSHVFERFYRAPRARGSKAEGGTGIGLTVVRGLAEAMGGSAEARKSSLGGLAVVVRLPAETVEMESEAAEVVEPDAEPADRAAAAEASPEPAEVVEPDSEPAEAAAPESETAETVAPDSEPAETAEPSTEAAEVVEPDSEALEPADSGQQAEPAEPPAGSIAGEPS